jgi:hypothetical protein
VIAKAVAFNGGGCEAASFVEFDRDANKARQLAPDGGRRLSEAVHKGSANISPAHNKARTSSPVSA